jgi:hypothetical protein
MANITTAFDALADDLADRVARRLRGNSAPTSNAPSSSPGTEPERWASIGPMDPRTLALLMRLSEQLAMPPGLVIGMALGLLEREMQKPRVNKALRQTEKALKGP